MAFTGSGVSDRESGSRRATRRCQKKGLCVQLLVVKRGRLNTFRMLSGQFADIQDIQVIWDRRSGADRRERTETVVPERRGQERRRPQDRHGPAGEYVVVSVANRVETCR